jgi:hypothetical protein
MAASRDPSADDASVNQFVMGAIVCAQFVPELVETKIAPTAFWL